MTDLFNDPAALWYLTRATGLVVLVVLTLVTALGVASTTAAAGGRVPRFVATDLHRRLSVFALALLVAHIATAVWDGFVTISWADALIPFSGTYRPFWLGLGSLAFDLLVAVMVTALLRHRIGHEAWRWVHYLVYAAWPIAVLHGLGTGSDARRGPVQALTVACVALVLLAVAQRLLATPGRLGAARVVTLVLLPVLPLALAAWAIDGPLAPGWAKRAGTPPPVVTSAQK